MSDALLASAMRKVLMSEDMYVDPEGDRLRLDGHVHGGLSADEMVAVRAVVAERWRAEDDQEVTEVEFLAALHGYWWKETGHDE